MESKGTVFHKNDAVPFCLPAFMKNSKESGNTIEFYMEYDKIKINTYCRQ